MGAWWRSVCIVGVGFILGWSQLIACQFTILTFNDVYRFAAHNGFGGLPGISTMLKIERLHTKHSLTCVNGDFLSPSLMSTITHGAHMVEIFNHIGVDLVVLGNHEFDFGTHNVLDMLGRSRFQWLGANCVDALGVPLTGKEQMRIETIDDIKIGFFGVITPDTAWLSKADDGVYFKPTLQTAKEMINRLKEEGCEVFIAITHLSINEDRLLAQECPELHCILGGHEHFPMTWYEGSTFIHKSGYDAQFLCRVDLEMTRDTKGSLQVIPTWKMLANRGQVPDLGILRMVDRYMEDLNVQLNMPVATLQEELDSRDVRSRESNFGDLVADAFRSLMNVDCALVNAGAIRGGRSHAPGPLLKATLVSEMPFSNCVGILQLTGEQLQCALEHGLKHYGEGRGSFLQVSGIRVLFDAQQPPGSRLLQVWVGEQPLELHKTYRVACMDYLIAGGDGYKFLCEAPQLRPAKDGPLALDLLIQYLTQGGWLIQPFGERLVRQQVS